ncbi:unnamed protein product [Musa textilis]
MWISCFVISVTSQTLPSSRLHVHVGILDPIYIYIYDKW